MAPFAFLQVMPPAWTKQVHFDLDLTWQNGAPDGNMREMIFMNDQFPGPELRLNQGDGDKVEVLVHNSLPFNITVHFHGIEQRNTACPGPDVQQPFRLISSNENDIEAIKEAEKNPQLVTVSDWGHLISGQYRKAMEDNRLGVFCSYSVLINDRGAVFCPGTENIFNLELSYLKTAIGNQPLRGKGSTPASVMPLDNRAIKPYPPVTTPKSVDQLVSLTIGRVDSAYMWSTFGGGLYDMITK
ncbi:hypothetical protein N7499_001592 [Penicillium canescens]|uniref:Plastocyanin-like domain-containing protein n=1 Tax=Penicillium canescens TaxID=5083 RepID=A0AAD6N5N0_PENCN|nr:uncharacterized protein N7446_009135 [Penicillium canescens]KAJ6034386.1 hypothetical protein N7460_008561 [Penicillium canescens]KAJ6046047.1 hypothetical protein N7444_007301 [Penicillium canescens]KAJ6053123.1 hypothetical protein N7446_009135 [Penicillium canescens]KAJ6097218.1 hypothetical protein N7499_001592 [Penicillium canescens]KAJ6165208.1 hypothetical protein N7485_008452 [Penicillium canescens]